MSDFASGQAALSLDESAAKIEQVSRQLGTRLQPELDVGGATDPLEREADRVADTVVASLANPLQLRRSSKVRRADHGPGERGRPIESPPDMRVQRAAATTTPALADPHTRIQRRAVPALPTTWAPMTRSADHRTTIRRVMSSNSFKTNGAYTATGGAVRQHLDKFLAILESAEMLAGPSVPASLRKSLVVALSQRLSDLWSPMDDGIDFLEAIGEESELYGLLAQIEDELEADEETLGDEADNELGEDDFTTDNETGSKSEKVGGGLNKLDEVKYTFGLVADGRRTKDPDGTFASYFKEDKEVDDQYGKHRGSRSDIPQNKPEFGKRSLAMYQLDQLLSASLVPPTFRASREGRIGIVMEKVAGRKALADETNRNVLDGKSATEAEMLQPQVREAMSNLSLLDYIAGQVDRHPGNYLIVKQPDGTIDVKAIDNDLAFGVKYLEMVDQVDGASAAIRSEVTAGVLPIMLKEIDSAFAQRIIALASIPKILDDALWGLLSSEEIEATKARLSRLADFLQPLITQNDDRVVTKWG